jgi:hypothetical protein
MRPLPVIPATSVEKLDRWSNFHHTIVGRPVQAYLTPGALGFPPGAKRGEVLAPALNSILDYCLADPPQRLCMIGARWSLSNILDPAQMILDPGVWNEITAVDSNWLTPEYRAAAAAKGGVPVIAQGGTNVRTLNSFLGQYKLALQTTGASDGHRIAGCIATGTHGSHLKVGAVHDTVLGVVLVTGPNQAVFLQPARRSFTPDLARWFQDHSHLPTREICDDELFNAARVSLGGLGFVHSVIVETVPLYEWQGEIIGRPLFDPEIWRAIETLDTSALDPGPTPDYFSVIFSPFAPLGQSGCFATLMWKKPAAQAYSAAPPVQPTTSTDLTRLLSRLIPAVDGGLVGDLISDVVARETASQYLPGPIAPCFPGTIFGPTTLPEGNGRSSEVAVNHQHASAALRVVIDTLRSEARAGRHLLGGVGVRFAPGSQALLGMNIHPMNTYIEFPSLNSANTSAVQRAIWGALREANIPFTCHWGQEYGMDEASVRAYYGERVDRWVAARHALLTTAAARAVFTNPLLTELGLDR